MDKRLGGVLAIAGLTASLFAGMGAADAAPRGEREHLRDTFADAASYGVPTTTGATDASPAHVSGTARMELRGDNGALRQAVTDAGGTVIGEIDGVVHATVPEAQASALEAHPAVESAGPLPRLRTAEQSEGVTLTGANTWLTAGTDGTGIDVAIVDLGFAGWEGQLGTELPASVATSFGSCAASEDTDHGTAVAEIVHDMAPGATLHLICVDDTFDLYPNSIALDYLAANDIEVASASIGTFTDEPRRRQGRHRPSDQPEPSRRHPLGGRLGQRRRCPRADPQGRAHPASRRRRPARLSYIDSRRRQRRRHLRPLHQVPCARGRRRADRQRAGTPSPSPTPTSTSSRSPPPPCPTAGS